MMHNHNRNGLHKPDSPSFGQTIDQALPAMSSLLSRGMSPASAQCSPELDPCLTHVSTCTSQRSTPRTKQTVAIIRLWRKVLTVCNHGGAHMSDRRDLLLIFRALSNPLDIVRHGFVHLVHAYASQLATNS